eukprot:988963-Rhodomonas_salina.2
MSIPILLLRRYPGRPEDWGSDSELTFGTSSIDLCLRIAATVIQCNPLQVHCGAGSAQPWSDWAQYSEIKHKKPHSWARKWGSLSSSQVVLLRANFSGQRPQNRRCRLVLKPRWVRFVLALLK